MQYIRPLLLLIPLVLTACRSTDNAIPLSDSSAPEKPPLSSPVVPNAIRPEIISVQGESYQIYAFEIPLKQYRIAAVDLSTSKSLRSALDRKGSVLVINAGYFDKNNNPEGLVVSEGKSLSEFKPSLVGGVLTITGQLAQLHDSVGFIPTPQLDFAIQCKPRLVVDGKSNIKTDDKKAAARTAVCLKKGGSSLEFFVTQDQNNGPNAGPSLATLADILLARDCEQALNLDGGPSSGAFWQEEGSTKGFAPQANIRQALVIQSI